MGAIYVRRLDLITTMIHPDNLWWLLFHNCKSGHPDDCLPCIHAGRLKICHCGQSLTMCLAYVNAITKFWQCIRLMSILQQRFFVFLRYYGAGIASGPGSNSAQQLLFFLEYALQDVLILGVHMLAGELTCA